jgi:hypothetical protein
MTTLDDASLVVFWLRARRFAPQFCFRFGKLILKTNRKNISFLSCLPLTIPLCRQPARVLDRRRVRSQKVMQAKFFDQSSFCTAERRHFLWTVKGTTFA